MTPRSPVSAETMLTVLAYFRDRGPVEIGEAASALSLSEGSLRKTLAQLWTCGLPGYGPGELIDLAFSSDDPAENHAAADSADAFDDDSDPVSTAQYVEVTFSAGIDRPLRLSFEEAVTLQTALATLVGKAEVVDQAGLREALEMLGAVTTPAARLDGMGTAVDDVTTRSATADQLRDALAAGQAVRFLYHSANSDTSRIRIVDGGRLQLGGDHTYLRGVERESGEWRTFRADRIADVERLGDSREVGPEPDAESDRPARSTRAQIVPGAEWFLDEYPFAGVDREPEGTIRVRIDYYDDAWLVRFLLGNASSLTPLDPEIRRQVAGEAAAALSAYDVPGPTAGDSAVHDSALPDSASEQSDNET